MNHLQNIVINSSAVVAVLIMMKMVGILQWSWWLVLLPLWLPSLLGSFVLAVVFVHDAMATPEDKESARQRRHQRNWGL
jgi:ABC-type uncharacterized transport system permease subunit